MNCKFFPKRTPIWVAILLLSFNMEIGICLEKDKSQFTPDDILIGKKYDQSGPANDLKLLRYALEKGYIGFFFLDPKIKEKVFAELDNLLPKSDSMSPEDLCNTIGKILESVPDSHLQVQFDRRLCPLKKLKPDRVPSVGPNFGMKQARSTRSPWDISSFDLGKYKIPVISIFRFPSIMHPDWQGFDSAFRVALNAPVLVIDLRGNGGGDDSKAFEIARKLIGEKFQTPQESKKTRVTVIAKALFLNKTLIQIQEYKNSGKVAPDALLDEERKRRGEFEKSKSNLNAEEFESYSFPTEYGASRSFNKPIFVLIDSDCGSTGELLALALKNAPKVTTIGENTAGFLQFGNPGVLILPYSQLRVEIPITYKKFRRSGLLEKVGITHDVFVSPGQNAMDYAKEKIKFYLENRSK